MFVIKEAIGQNTSRRQKFPNKKVENFNKYFAEISSNLANKISIPLENFDTYPNNKCNIFHLENGLIINELKDAFYSLKTKKSSGYNGISSNII